MRLRIYWISITVLLIAVTALVSYSAFSSKRIAYVDLPRMMAEFEMSKEYELKLKSQFQKDQKQLDSLNKALIELDTISLEEKRYRYNQTAQAFERRYSANTKDLNDQVLRKLNIYMKQYAEYKDLDFVFGAEGSGVIMAANSNLDLTTEAIQYINKKYQGES